MKLVIRIAPLIAVLSCVVSGPALNVTLNAETPPLTKGLGTLTSQASSLVQQVGVQITPNQPATAQLRLKPGICQEELNVIEKRLPLIQKAIEALVGQKVDPLDMPRIGFCFSGGGYRAMFATIGWLNGASGAQDNNLLSATLYISTLSGSTWALAPWISSGLSLKNFYTTIKNKNNFDIFDFNLDTARDCTHLLTKLYYKQPISIVDFYGAMLASKLLVGLSKNASYNPHSYTLSAQRKIVKDGLRPYPIYTAILPLQIDSNETYKWTEFTPHEVSVPEWGCSLPSWAFGRAFNKGTSNKFEPEQSLGFLMGIWGSAFSASAKDAYQQMKRDIPAPLRPFVLDAITLTGQQNARIASQINNFAKNKEFEGIELDQDAIALVDAGLNFNIPLPPLLRTARKLDLIIICDASKEVSTDINDFNVALAWAEENGYTLPTVDAKKTLGKVFSAFEAKEDGVPSIVYMPLISNPKYPDAFDVDQSIKKGYARTENFNYTLAQIKQLSGLTRFTIEQNKPKIIDLIKNIIARKQQARTKSSRTPTNQNISLQP